MAHKNKSNYSPYRARNPEGNKGPLMGKHRRPDEVFSREEANDRLYDIFKNHNFNHVTHEERSKLAHFYELLMKTQEFNNFTRLLKIRDVAIRHFIDCRIVADLVQLQFPLLDVGTGPGFPGIPLKIHFQKEQILLAEGVQKRVEFLKQIREQLALPNLDIIGRNINPHFVYPVQGVITRAVEDVRNTLQNVLSCVQEGGCVYFMKGPNVDPELEQLGGLTEFYELEKDIRYELPKTEHKRRLVIFRKIKNAPLPEEEDNDILLDESI